MSPKMIVLQRQPTRTSCGPTCVAMLVGVPVMEILAQLPGVRKIPRKRHSTGMAELIRLLQPYGLTLGRRMRFTSLPLSGTVLLRIGKPGCNWHWAIWHDGTVYSPSQTAPYPFSAFSDVSWYAVEAR